jgi:hypothetical protein
LASVITAMSRQNERVLKNSRLPNAIQKRAHSATGANVSATSK